MLFQIAEGDCGKAALPPVALGACSIFGAPLKRQLRGRRRVDGLSRTTLISPQSSIYLQLSRTNRRCHSEERFAPFAATRNMLSVLKGGSTNRVAQPLRLSAKAGAFVLTCEITVRSDDYFSAVTISEKSAMVENSLSSSASSVRRLRRMSFRARR